MGLAAEFGVGGYREAVINVDQLEETAAVFEDVLGFATRHTGDADERQKLSWDVPDATTIDERLMGPVDVDHGLVRMVRINGAATQPIRPSGQPWESGGIYDLDLRVRDIEDIYWRLESRGWTGVHVPLKYRMGPVVVKHAELFGPDRIVLALIERVDPPLDGSVSFGDVSNAFNSTQLLQEDEVAAHDHFYRNVLGFDCLIDTEITWDAPGENVFGLPYNIAMQSPAPVHIYHPSGEMAGSVETCAIRGLTGEHYGVRALPCNRGLSALRFPVGDIEGYARHIEQNGVALAQPIHRLHIAPYGEQRVFAVRAPAGAWLEFFSPA